MNGRNQEQVSHNPSEPALDQSTVDEPFVAWLLRTGYALHWTWRLAVSAGNPSSTLHYSGSSSARPKDVP
jgi:hypothetical protein